MSGGEERRPPTGSERDEADAVKPSIQEWSGRPGVSEYLMRTLHNGAGIARWRDEFGSASSAPLSG